MKAFLRACMMIEIVRVCEELKQVVGERALSYLGYQQMSLNVSYNSLGSSDPASSAAKMYYVKEVA